MTDVLRYADHFREEACRELDRQVTSISFEACAKLESYGWPGNLRELRNVIRRAVLFTVGEIITLESLPLLSDKQMPMPEQKDISLSRVPDLEKEKIIEALDRVRGNKTKAALLLQIDRKTLYNKIHLYGIKL